MRRFPWRAVFAIEATKSEVIDGLKVLIASRAHIIPRFLLQFTQLHYTTRQRCAGLISARDISIKAQTQRRSCAGGVGTDP
jgi:hypothetical protein